MIGFTLAMFLFVAAAAAATWMAPPAYRPLEHGIDDLGGQHDRKNWIMRSGYLGYAALLLANAVYAFLIGRTPFYPSALLALEALAAGASAFFGKRPFLQNRPCDEKEHHRHERFIQASFVFPNAAMVLAWFSDDSPRSILHLALAIACFFLFALHRLAPRYQGLCQKLLYALIFLWQALLFPRAF